MAWDYDASSRLQRHLRSLAGDTAEQSQEASAVPGPVDDGDSQAISADYRARVFGSGGGDAPAEEEPSAISKYLGAAGAVLGAPKSAVDYLGRKVAQAEGIPQQDGVSLGHMMRGAVGLDAGEAPGYGGRLGGKGVEFATDLATDPVTYLAGAAGKAAPLLGKAATTAFAATMAHGAVQEGGKAIDTYLREGFTPQAAEETLGAGLSAGGALMAGHHLYGEAAAARAGNDLHSNPVGQLYGEGAGKPAAEVTPQQPTEPQINGAEAAAGEAAANQQTQPIDTTTQPVDLSSTTQPMSSALTIPTVVEAPAKTVGTGKGPTQPIPEASFTRPVAPPPPPAAPAAEALPPTGPDQYETAEVPEASIQAYLQEQGAEPPAQTGERLPSPQSPTQPVDLGPAPKPARHPGAVMFDYLQHGRIPPGFDPQVLADFLRQAGLNPDAGQVAYTDFHRTPRGFREPARPAHVPSPLDDAPTGPLAQAMAAGEPETPTGAMALPPPDVHDTIPVPEPQPQPEPQPAPEAPLLSMTPAGQGLEGQLQSARAAVGGEEHGALSGITRYLPEPQEADARAPEPPAAPPPPKAETKPVVRQPKGKRIISFVERTHGIGFVEKMKALKLDPNDPEDVAEYIHLTGDKPPDAPRLGGEAAVPSREELEAQRAERLKTWEDVKVEAPEAREPASAEPGATAKLADQVVGDRTLAKQVLAAQNAMRVVKSIDPAKVDTPKRQARMQAAIQDAAAARDAVHGSMREMLQAVKDKQQEGIKAKQAAQKLREGALGAAQREAERLANLEGAEGGVPGAGVIDPRLAAQLKEAGLIKDKKRANAVINRLLAQAKANRAAQDEGVRGAGARELSKKEKAEVERRRREAQREGRNVEKVYPKPPEGEDRTPEMLAAERTNAEAQGQESSQDLDQLHSEVEQLLDGAMDPNGDGAADPTWQDQRGRVQERLDSMLERGGKDRALAIRYQGILDALEQPTGEHDAEVGRRPPLNLEAMSQGGPEGEAITELRRGVDAGPEPSPGIQKAEPYSVLAKGAVREGQRVKTHGNGAPLQMGFRNRSNTAPDYVQQARANVSRLQGLVDAALDQPHDRNSIDTARDLQEQLKQAHATLAEKMQRWSAELDADSARQQGNREEAAASATPKPKAAPQGPGTLSESDLAAMEQDYHGRSEQELAERPAKGEKFESPAAQKQAYDDMAREEQELGRRVQQDPASADAAANRLVDLHEALANSYARQAMKRGRGRGMSLEDLQAVGYEALHDAAKRWDPRHGKRFSTYAGTVISGRLRDAIRDEATGGRRGQEKGATSLNETRTSGEGEESDAPINSLQSKFPGQEQQLGQVEMIGKLREAIKSLPEDEQKVMHALLDMDPETQSYKLPTDAQVARQLDMTRAEVKAARENAFRVLRETAPQDLRDYLAEFDQHPESKQTLPPNHEAVVNLRDNAVPVMTTPTGEYVISDMHEADSPLHESPELIREMAKTPGMVDLTRVLRGVSKGIQKVMGKVPTAHEKAGQDVRYADGTVGPWKAMPSRFKGWYLNFGTAGRRMLTGERGQGEMYLNPVDIHDLTHVIMRDAATSGNKLRVADELARQLVDYAIHEHAHDAYGHGTGQAMWEEYTKDLHEALRADGQHDTLVGDVRKALAKDNFQLLNQMRDWSEQAAQWREEKGIVQRSPTDGGDGGEGGSSGKGKVGGSGPASDLRGAAEGERASPGDRPRGNQGADANDSGGRSPGGLRLEERVPGSSGSGEEAGALGSSAERGQGRSPGQPGSRTSSYAREPDRGGLAETSTDNPEQEAARKRLAQAKANIKRAATAGERKATEDEAARARMFEFQQSAPGVREPVTAGPNRGDHIKGVGPVSARPILPGKPLAYLAEGSAREPGAGGTAGSPPKPPLPVDYLDARDPAGRGLHGEAEREIGKMSWWDHLVKWVADSGRRLIQFQKMAEGKGLNLKDRGANLDANQALEHYSGKAGARLRNLEEHVFEPLAKEMAKDGVTWDGFVTELKDRVRGGVQALVGKAEDLGERLSKYDPRRSLGAYLEATHAPARNNSLAEAATAGGMVLGEGPHAGISNEQAYNHRLKLDTEAKPQVQALHKYAERVWDEQANMLMEGIRDGLWDADQVVNWRKQWTTSRAESGYVSRIQEMQQRGVLTPSEAEGYMKVAEGKWKEQVGNLLADGKITAEEAALLRTVALEGRDYVPLSHSEAENFGGGESTATGPGMSLTPKEYRAAAGRHSRADNPAAWALFHRARMIVRGEKNNVIGVLHNLAQHYMAKFPEQKIFDIDKRFTSRTQNKQGTIVEEGAIDPNAVIYKDHGRTVRISIADHDLRDVYKRVYKETELGKLFTAIGKGTKFYSRLVTGLNPEFMFRNLPRDVGDAVINVYGAEGKSVAATAGKNVFAAIRGVWKGQKLGLDAKIPELGKAEEWHHVYQEALRAGLPSGSTRIRGPIELENHIGALLEKHKDGMLPATQRGFDQFAQVLEHANTAVEMGTRVSVYKAVRDAEIAKGTSHAEAVRKAVDAGKAATVNFDKRGTMSPQLGSLYAFFGANVQGSVQMAKTLAGPNGVKIAVALAGLGVLTDQYNRSVGADRDKDGINDWDQMQEWQKNRVLVLQGLPGIGKLPMPLMLPMPHGFSTLVSMGRLASAVAEKGITPSEAAASLGGSILTAFNPIDGSDIAQAITPTLADPFVQQAENRTWNGTNIHPDNLPGQHKPQSQLYYKSVSPVSKHIAQWLNSASGGDEVTSGGIDFSPELIDHYMSFMGGGVGTVASHLMKAVGETKDTGAPSIRDIPVLRSIVYDQHPAEAGARFRANLDDLDAMWDRYQAYAKSKAPEDRAKLRQMPMEVLRTKKLVDSINSQIQGIKRAGSAVPNAEDRIAQLQLKANRLVADARKRSGLPVLQTR